MTPQGTTNPEVGNEELTVSVVVGVHWVTKLTSHLGVKPLGTLKFTVIVVVGVQLDVDELVLVLVLVLVVEIEFKLEISDGRMEAVGTGKNVVQMSPV